MKVTTYIPHPNLREYVIGIATVDVSLPEGVMNVASPYPPSPFQSLMFYCQDPISMGRFGSNEFQEQPPAVLVGPQSTRINLKVQKRLKAIRVDFFPGALFRMLTIPMHELLDEGLDATIFFGDAIKVLTDKLFYIESLFQGKALVEDFLLEQVRKSIAILPFDSAMQLFLKNAGSLSIEQTASLSCLSLRQFERQCQNRIGMNPKMYARILRFSKAYCLHERFPRLTWLDIAHRAGYYDQMHMIRDFKVFSGVLPSTIETELIHTPFRMHKDIPY